MWSHCAGTHASLAASAHRQHTEQAWLSGRRQKQSTSPASRHGDTLHLPPTQWPRPSAHDVPLAACRGAGQVRDRPSQTEANVQSVGLRQPTPAAAIAHPSVQQRCTRGLQSAFRRHARPGWVVPTLRGTQHRSCTSHEYVVPQSHSSPRSTTALPQYAAGRGTRHWMCRPSAIIFDMDCLVHLENIQLCALVIPDVYMDMMYLPWAECFDGTQSGRSAHSSSCSAPNECPSSCVSVSDINASGRRCPALTCVTASVLTLYMPPGNEAMPGKYELLSHRPPTMNPSVDATHAMPRTPPPVNHHHLRSNDRERAFPLQGLKAPCF